ncbi:MAG: transcription-repair coupling factor [Acutalibacter muris]|nr:transcription-repair coupling factor [Acutalibacter muris]
MRSIFSALSRSPEYVQLQRALSSGDTPAVAAGVSGVHKCVLTAGLMKGSGKRALVVAADEAEAQRFTEDLKSLGLNPANYPLRDFNFRDSAVSSHEYERQRLRALSRLRDGSCDCIVSCIDAALQLTLGPEELDRRLFTLSSGQALSIDQLLSALTSCGYTREDQIEGPGQFSRRGGIVDFFSPNAPLPVRVEFWGDEIDSISSFDPATQRRTDPLPEVTLAPCTEVIPQNRAALIKRIEALSKSLRGKRAPKAKEILMAEAQKLADGLSIGCMDKYLPLVYERPATLFDYFNERDSLIVFSEGTRLKERVRTTLVQWSEDLTSYLEDGLLCKGLDKYSETWEYALSQAQRVPSFFMDVFARGTYEIPTKTLVNITVRQFPAWGGGVQLLQEDLSALLRQGRACVVLSGTERAGKALAEDLKQSGLPAAYIEDPSTAAKGTVTVAPGSLSAGFDWPDAGFALISRGRIAAGAAVKKIKKNKNAREISSLSELSPGDYVVHATHGIGVFEGIHKVEMNGIEKDYILIRYARNDSLYVPVTQLDMVSKYIGPREDSGIRLSRLGGADWQQKKQRVRAAVKNIAKELIELYAKRMQQEGFPFPEDGEWQRDFESRFEFEETDDQLRCVGEIKSDMERAVPMDRLLCGDVGFGKTEVALRAAFKCVTGGKQCAILVPTTILAWQHYQTILRRMEGFPIDVGLLSRFRSPKQQEETLKRLKRGAVDIVVGTHRLVSKDVKFKDLGLVIIDEEQRFGVAQKEKLKALCSRADVLTLSATPIPRTLNMALSGIRDMSVIEEAPQDRHPVQTYVMEHDNGVICDAIRRELRRGGQVYYLHNDTASISRTAARLQEAIPEARVGFGHGKMDEEELSEVWRQLLDHEIDILVCTTIIETGVDVPSANTLIIENADRMGLSQLHQLRGRVGRSSRRAYAYLTYTPNKSLQEIAQKRLSAIREFTEFGSGFKIAMRDLEIRGAGNVLGGEQHGHMEAVGYDMYVKLLNEAVSLMKGEEVKAPVDEGCTVDMQVSAHIPEDYIESIDLRLEVYRRIAGIQDQEDALDVTDELIDRFGEPPEAVRGLIEIALLRGRAAWLGINEIKQQNDSLLLYQREVDMAQVERLIKARNGQVMVSAGSKPYLSVKLGGAPPLEVLSRVLKIMGENE